MKLINFCVGILLIASTVGCREAKLGQLAGRYQGTLTINSATFQVVAEVPAAKEKGQFKTLQFSIFKTLGSAKPERVFVQIADSFMTLQSPILGKKEYKLNKRSGNCGFGENTETKIKLCIAAGKIDLEANDKLSNQVIISIRLLKDGSLPALPKSGEQEGYYSLDELMGRARFSNYTVSQDAERVFQAKQRIKIAVGNLLPHFNMKDLLAFVSGGPLGGVDAIGSFLPFLFPSNWYKVDEAKDLAKAKGKSFASLRGNEMQYVETTYYLVSRDLAIQEFLEKDLLNQKEIHKIIEKKESFGLLPPKSAEKYYLTILTMEQDLLQLKTLIELEQSSLAHSVALPASSGIKKLLPILLPDLANEGELNASSYIKTAQEKSLEVSTLNYLIKANKLNSKTHAWGFLDPNSNDVMGFGYAAMLRVGKSGERELVNKKEETLSLIDQKTVIAIAEYNNSLRSFKIAKVGLLSGDERLKRLRRQLQVGDARVTDEYYVQEIVNANNLLLKSNANHITAIYAFLMAKSKLQRLMLEGFYQDLETTVE